MSFLEIGVIFPLILVINGKSVTTDDFLLSNTTVNATCVSSIECDGKLVCVLGKCQCSENHYWNGSRCLQIKAIGTVCEENSGCHTSLYCIDGTCQCAAKDYWVPNRCIARKKVNETCGISYECFGKLLCIKDTCQCSEQHHWNGTNCQMMYIVGGQCKKMNDCGESLICSEGKCQCARQYYWNGISCSKRKPYSEKCHHSEECLDHLICNNQCQCPVGFFGNDSECYIQKECSDIDYKTDGVHIIYPGGIRNPTVVYCVLQNGEKWTVIQRNTGSPIFNSTWNEYKVGFGSVSGDHWLGNENIHLISTNGKHALKVLLENKSGTKWSAEYSTFWVRDEDSEYQLIVTGYKGTAGDSLDNVGYGGRASGSNFSTMDRGKSQSCAVSHKGGWWYAGCYYGDLNGAKQWTYNIGSVSKTMMMIRKI